MAQEPRRFDTIDKVVKDLRIRVDDLQSTVMSRMASHMHPESPGPYGGTGVGSFRVAMLEDDLTVRNSETSVPFLSLSTVPGARYLVDGFIVYHSPTNADARWYLSPLADGSWWGTGGIPTSATSRVWDYEAIAAAPGFNITTGGDGSVVGDDYTTPVRLMGVAVAASTSVSFRFTQATAQNADSVVRANSWMRFLRVS
jgi:hypothetical protein